MGMAEVALVESLGGDCALNQKPWSFMHLLRHPSIDVYTGLSVGSVDT